MRGRSRRTQHPAMPVVGFLRSASLTDASHLVTGFRQGLAMMLSSKTFRASWSIGLAAALVAAGPARRSWSLAEADIRKKSAGTEK
jgi:hypothetical protein